MKLKDHVITLNQAKRLKELWFRKESEFVWNEDADGDTRISSRWISKTNVERWNQYHAYTLSELWEYLPDGYSTMRTGGERRAYNPPEWYGFWGMLWDCFVSFLYKSIAKIECVSEVNEVQTRCALLIDLLETGVLLEVDTSNWQQKDE